MKKLISGTFLVLFAMLVMYMTKPTSTDFDDFIDERYARNEKAEGSGLERVIDKGISRALAFQIKQTKHYDDNMLFAMVKARELDQEVKYIGLLGMWFTMG